MMLEGKSCLVSRSLAGCCEPESEWAYLAHEVSVLSGKRPAPEEGFEVEDMDEAEGGSSGKRSKSPSPQPHTPDITEGHGSNRHVSSGGGGGEQQGSGSNLIGEIGRDLSINCLLRLSRSDHGSSRHVSSGGGGGEQQGSGSNLIGEIGRDLSINCLLRLSRSDYGFVASLNRDFNSLVRNGEIYRLRRQNGIAEHWVYFSCNVLEWDAYDPYRGRWIQVPKMPPDECFMCSDKESLAVGTELLVFGMAHIVFRYSILTNSWTWADPMNSPRCLFGSTSVGEKAYVAGGTDASGKILSSAEMYDSETHTWTPLPSMHRERKMCSGLFMDGKFYVIGGVTHNNKVLFCGEEYDLKRQSWRVIENMSEGLNGVTGAPPLIAVVNNELYAADYSEKDVKKYDKLNNKWITLGKLPERSVSMNGWGLAFRACGDRLIVIGGPRTSIGGMIEINSWVPDQQPPVWNLVARRPSGNFVYNCAVMGC